MSRTYFLLFASVAFGACLITAPAANAQACELSCTPYEQEPPYDDISSGGEVCPAVNSYDSCVERCECEYSKNRKKCGRNLWCLDVATSERNACLGNCITDWS